MKLRYAHTNLVARDWRALARFYTEVFGCEQVGPERDLHGATVAAGIGREGSRLAGVHLRLPGFGLDGPTLELYRYDPLTDTEPSAVLRRGYGHLAFEVDDLVGMHARVLAAGGRAVGAVVTTPAGSRWVTWCYVTDPEGNPIELQRWWQSPEGLVVRPERDADRHAVRQCNRDAFGRDAEADLVDALRHADVARRAWVAVLDEKVVGHLLVTAVTVEAPGRARGAWAIGPMSAAPAAQRTGVGTALLATALAALRDEGADRVFVLGHPSYYPRLGFERADARGLRWEGGHDEAFFVLGLRPGFDDFGSGVVRYHPLFGGAGRTAK